MLDQMFWLLGAVVAYPLLREVRLILELFIRPPHLPATPQQIGNGKHRGKTTKFALRKGTDRRRTKP